MLNVTVKELGFTLSVQEILDSFAQGLDVVCPMTDSSLCSIWKHGVEWSEGC